MPDPRSPSLPPEARQAVDEVRLTLDAALAMAKHGIDGDCDDRVALTSVALLVNRARGFLPPVER